MLIKLQRDLRKLANPKRAKNLQRFFKTGKGEYGEGDVFLGISVPEQRKLVVRYELLDLDAIQKLLKSKIHEERMVALLILIEKFRKSETLGKKEIFDFYLNNTENINNWDLVDLSAIKISGAYLIDKDKSIIFNLLRSMNVWRRRIGVLTTFYFIKFNQYDISLKAAEILINDKHDLIHKATGWMLREIGKRDIKIEEDFLKKYYKKMPRTMLRYAIEKFPEAKRRFYLKR